MEDLVFGWNEYPIGYWRIFMRWTQKCHVVRKRNAKTSSHFFVELISIGTSTTTNFIRISHGLGTAQFINRNSASVKKWTWNFRLFADLYSHRVFRNSFSFNWPRSVEPMHIGQWACIFRRTCNVLYDLNGWICFVLSHLESTHFHHDRNICHRAERRIASSESSNDQTKMMNRWMKFVMSFRIMRRRWRWRRPLFSLANQFFFLKCRNYTRWKSQTATQWNANASLVPFRAHKNTAHALELKLNSIRVNKHKIRSYDFETRRIIAMNFGFRLPSHCTSYALFFSCRQHGLNAQPSYCVVPRRINANRQHKRRSPNRTDISKHMSDLV